MNMHDDAAPARAQRTRGDTGTACLVCHKAKGKPVRIVVESPSGTRLAEHDAAVCDACAGDRFMIRAAAERTTR